MEITVVLTIITTVTSIITAAVLIFTYRQNKEQNKIHFELTSVNTGHEPNTKITGIHIKNPTKPIEHCQVFCNGIALEANFGINTQNWLYIHTGENGDFFLPEDLSDRENAKIKVIDGKKTLRKAKLKDLPFLI